MKRERIIASVLLASALVLGGALGAIGYRWASEDTVGCRAWGGRGHEAYIDRLDEELRLTPDQRREVAAVLERQREAMATIWREVRPRAEEVRRTARQEVNALLTPGQQRRYAEIQERAARERSRKSPKVPR